MDAAELALLRQVMARRLPPSEQQAVRAIADQLLQEMQAGSCGAAAKHAEEGAGASEPVDAAAHAEVTAAPGCAGGGVGTAQQQAAGEEATGTPELASEEGAPAEEPAAFAPEGLAATPAQALPLPVGKPALSPRAPRGSPTGSPLISPRAGVVSIMKSPSPTGSPLISPRSAGFASPRTSPRGGLPPGRASPFRPPSPLGCMRAAAMTPPLPGGPRPGSAGSSIELDSPLEEAVDELISSICGTPFQELPDLSTPTLAQQHILQPAAAAGEAAGSADACAAALDAAAPAGSASEAPRVSPAQDSRSVAAQPSPAGSAGEAAAELERAVPDQAPSPQKAPVTAVRITALHVRVEHNDENQLPGSFMSPGKGLSASPKPVGAPTLGSPGLLRSPLAHRSQSGWQSPVQPADAQDAVAEDALLAAADDRNSAMSKAPAGTLAVEEPVSGKAMPKEEHASPRSALLSTEPQQAVPKSSRPAADLAACADTAAAMTAPAMAMLLAAAAAAVAEPPSPAQQQPCEESMLSPAAVLAAGMLEEGTPARGLVVGRAPMNTPMTAAQQGQGAGAEGRPALTSGDQELPTPTPVVPFPVHTSLLCSKHALGG